MAQANAYLNPEVYDQGLDWIVANGTVLHLIASSLGGVPVNMTEVNNNTLGNETGLTVTGPTNGDVSGRKVTIPEVTAGEATDDGTAGYWALVNTAEDTLIAAQDLSATKEINNGDTWTNVAMDIEFPAPAT